MFLRSKNQSNIARRQDNRVEKQFKEYGIPYGGFDIQYTDDEDAAIVYIYADRQIPEDLKIRLLNTKSERENRYSNIKPVDLGSHQVDFEEMRMLGEQLSKQPDIQLNPSINNKTHTKLGRSFNMTIKSRFDRRKSVK